MLILFCYELFDLWASPWWTAWLIIFYFLGVLVVDGFFSTPLFVSLSVPLASLILWLQRYHPLR